MTVTGPDVSSHQGTVDWQQVKAAGHTFGATKCTGGAWYINPTFGANWRDIGAAGLARMAYHYAFESSGQPYPGPGPEVEADVFLEQVLGQGPLAEGDMLALDIEEGPADLDLADWSLRWLRRVEARVGFRPLCYTGKWFTDQHGFGRVQALAGYPLWLAAYQETQPDPPAPWPMVAFWQKTDQASVPGIATPCDLNDLTDAAGAIGFYGKPTGAIAQPMPPAVAGPRYDATYPAISQNDDWSCSCTSARWALWAYGRQPSEAWLENSMLSSGIVTVDFGLMNSTGAALADWLTQEYGEAGYRGESDPSVTFDDVALEAAKGKHPLMMGGRNWGAGGHWTGVRGFEGGKIALANPASGYGGITQVMSREQFSYVGPFSLVRLVHPAAELGAPVPPTPVAPADPWVGQVGSGLLEMMAADGTSPAAPSSWLPLGAKPSMIEEAVGVNGTVYRWLIPTNQGYRYPPV